MRGPLADHCAVYHGRDGSGKSEVSQNLHPPVPDMRLARTQSLSDGELFYIIQNGVPFTGMPAWGGGSARADEHAWNLVRFIRNLPTDTAETPVRDHQHDHAHEHGE